MHLLLHIGMPKSGSTSIQQWLADACTPVRADVLVPDASLLPGTRAGNHLGIALYSGARRVWGQPLLADIRSKLPAAYRHLDLAAFLTAYDRDLHRCLAFATARGCTRMLLSDEYLSERLSREEIARLSDRFSGRFDRSSVIVYLRDQVSAYVSLYCETVKYGSRWRFSEFARQSWVHRLFDYESVLDDWRSGGFDLHPRIYWEADRRPEGWDLISDFGGVVWPHATERGGRADRFRHYRRNVTLSPGAYALAARFNTRRMPKTWRVRMVDALARIPGTSVRFEQRNATAFEAIRDRHESGNRHVARTYFGRDNLFEPEGPGVPLDDAPTPFGGVAFH